MEKVKGGESDGWRSEGWRSDEIRGGRSEERERGGQCVCMCEEDKGNFESVNCYSLYHFMCVYPLST